MAVRLYPAVITKGRDPGFTVQFVDLPEAITEGDTIEDAVLHAQEALLLALESRAEDGEDIPAPTGLTAARKKLDAHQRRDLVAIQLVAGMEPEPIVRVNVTLPGDLVKRIDAVAGTRGRSAFLADAVRVVLAGRTLTRGHDGASKAKKSKRKNAAA